MKNSCPDRITYAEKLRLSDLLRGPLFRSLIYSLKLPEGSRGLDVGCGTGSNTLLLAEAVGGSGHVAGIDLSGELLAHAVRRVQETGISQRTSFINCDMNRLAFSEHAFDWAWSADCAGYAPGDAASLTENIAKLVKRAAACFSWHGLLNSCCRDIRSWKRVSTRLAPASRPLSRDSGRTPIF